MTKEIRNTFLFASIIGFLQAWIGIMVMASTHNTLLSVVASWLLFFVGYKGYALAIGPAEPTDEEKNDPEQQ